MRSSVQLLSSPRNKASRGVPYQREALARGCYGARFHAIADHLPQHHRVCYTQAYMTAFDWASAKEGTQPPDDVYCQTRDVVQARIQTLQIILEKNGWSENDAALFTAILGELAGNCFDHNIGSWKDVPGCWFAYTIAPTTLHAIVADRGQGILGSLKRVRPDLKKHKEALYLAFTAQLSGRAPEKRGNGLKFVLRSLHTLPSPDFLFASGDAKLVLPMPVDSKEVERYITDEHTYLNGMYAELTIKR